MTQFHNIYHVSQYFSFCSLKIFCEILLNDFTKKAAFHKFRFADRCARWVDSHSYKMLTGWLTAASLGQLQQIAYSLASEFVSMYSISNYAIAIRCIANLTIPCETGRSSASAVVPSSVGLQWRETFCCSSCEIPRRSVRAALHFAPWRQQCISATCGRLRSLCQQAISCAHRTWSWGPSLQIWHRGCDLKQQREWASSSCYCNK